MKETDFESVASTDSATRAPKRLAVIRGDAVHVYALSQIQEKFFIMGIYLKRLIYLLLALYLSHNRTLRRTI